MRNIPCFIVGNSPTLNNMNLIHIKDMFTIGINRAFFKFNPTILFWQDIELWESEKNKLKTLKSIRVCHPKGDPLRRFFHFETKGPSFARPTNTSLLYGRGSTGALAVQFAYALGCSPIYLIGMDCVVSDGMTDFFGKNQTWKEHSQSVCMTGLEWINREFKNEKIINISSYPHMLNEILTKYKSHAKGIEYYKKILIGDS